MAKPDLIFITATNGDKVKAMAEGKGYVCKGCGNKVLGLHDCSSNS